MYGDGIFDMDADIETAEFEVAAGLDRQRDRLRMSGKCPHVNAEEQNNGRTFCFDCGEYVKREGI